MMAAQWTIAEKLPENGFLADPEKVILFLFQSFDIRDHPTDIRRTFFIIQNETISRLKAESHISTREAEMLVSILNVHYLEDILDLDKLAALTLSLTQYVSWPEWINATVLLKQVRQEFCKDMIQALNIDLRISLGLPSDIGISRRIIPNSDYSGFQNIGISFVNGIMNSDEEAIENALRLSSYAEGNVSLIYNRSHFIFQDLAECVMEKLTGKNLLPALLLQLQWEEFFKTHGEDAQFLQVCHSSGTFHVKYALQNSPYKNRITVLAVAPAAIITPDECYDSFNIASEADVIPLLNTLEDIKKYLEILPAHLDETPTLIDHGFSSKTYEEKIQAIINEFKDKHEK